jgi:hypothetical protein
MGIIGKTQGVKIEASPSPNAVSSSVPKLSDAEDAGDPVSGAEDGPPGGEAGSAAAETKAGLISAYPAGRTKAVGSGAAKYSTCVVLGDLRFGGKHCLSVQLW